MRIILIGEHLEILVVGWPGEVTATVKAYERRGGGGEAVNCGWTGKCHWTSTDMNAVLTKAEGGMLSVLNASTVCSARDSGTENTSSMEVWTTKADWSVATTEWGYWHWSELCGVCVSECVCKCLCVYVCVCVCYLMVWLIPESPCEVWGPVSVTPPSLPTPLRVSSAANARAALIYLQCEWRSEGVKEWRSEGVDYWHYNGHMVVWVETEMSGVRFAMLSKAKAWKCKAKERQTVFQRVIQKVQCQCQYWDLVCVQLQGFRCYRTVEFLVVILILLVLFFSLVTGWVVRAVITVSVRYTKESVTLNLSMVNKLQKFNFFVRKVRVPNIDH